MKERIIFEDKHIIGVNKPAGMPSQDDQTGDASAHALLTDYKNAKLHLTNRLDRPVSGVLLFAKDRKGMRQINDGNLRKRYLAVVGKGISEQGTLEDYLLRDGVKKKALIVSESHKLAKRSILYFEKVLELDRYDVIKIETRTGRFHQIRAQLAHLGYPIKGDVKYGARRKNADRSIDLHAVEVEMLDRELLFKAKINRADAIWKFISEKLESDTYHLSQAYTDRDLTGILQLQKLYTKAATPSDEIKEEGFVTCEHDLALLQKMGVPHGHSVVKYNEKVVAYCLTMENKWRDELPVIADLFKMVESLSYKDVQIQPEDYVVVGQVCVDKTHRKKGLFKKLYQQYHKTLSPHFKYCITEVATDNLRSLGAHMAVGFTVLDSYMAGDGISWEIVIWDWS